MVRKYKFGAPFETEAVTADLPLCSEPCPYGTVDTASGFSFTCTLGARDVVYGLGEAVRGINKRGYEYVSFATDDGNHVEDKRSLYGAHNFVVVAGTPCFGVFVDCPARLTFDIGYTRQDTLHIYSECADLYLYIIDGGTPYDIVRQFRGIIGRSYIPPKFAFGYGQSRWGYKTPEDFRTVLKEHRDAHVPLDMLYMDIDYMQDYKDFTVNGENFPDFPAFVAEMQRQHIHLVPIIDAGVKVEDGYPVYEEGVEKGYFCHNADGSLFTPAVWPGWTHFPDVLDPEARAWFGGQYRVLLDAGIDGFWNDMNEPAIFYSKQGLADLAETYREALPEGEDMALLRVAQQGAWLAGSEKDYARFYHNVGGQMVRHDTVHNLYGYNMTRAAAEAFARLRPQQRILLFSRSSYIGMHRYGGIWTGDNRSWWSHILLNLQMLPSLNMCGFLYVGADIGGFGSDTTRDLLLRWLELAVFVPLMRNHSGTGIRRQEFYQFEQPEDLRHVIRVRYRLLPYLYSEYMKAALGGDMLFKPLAFVYPDDPFAPQVEDQLMLGGEVMIAPVYTQNAAGRYVYLPEEMDFVKFLPDGTIAEQWLPQGHHYVEIALNEVAMFIRKGRCIPLVDAAEYVDALDLGTMQYLGDKTAAYELYDDDGITPVAE